MKKKIYSFLWNLIASGLPKDHDLESLRKIVMINIFAILGSIFIFPLGIVALLNGSKALFIADFVLGFVLVFMVFWVRKTQNPKYPGYIGSFLMTVFFLFLVGAGGVNQSAYVWIFCYPVVSVFVLGNKKGVFMSIVFINFTIIMFILGYYINFISRYSIDLIIRFVACYLFITLFIYIMERTRETMERSLIKKNLELKDSLEEVKTLSGLLPICLKCKKIRDDKGYWNQIEGYIAAHSEAKFSHSMCPECSDEFYGNEGWYKKMKVRKKH